MGLSANLRRARPAVVATGVLAIPGAALATPSQVVVSRGQPVQVALAVDLTGPTTSFTPSLENAVQMAVEAHPAIRGFAIEINVVDMPCEGQGGDTTPDQTAAANIVANAQNVAVLGTFCSTSDQAALPTFETAGLVTLSGSTTNFFNPTFGPDVFNSVIISDSPTVDLSDPWLAVVQTLPSDLAWQQAYTLQFGTAPGTYADLYYDATGLLIRELQHTSSIAGGNLVIDRGALAHAVRSTTKYHGVTGTITLDPTTGYRIDNLTSPS